MKTRPRCPFYGFFVGYGEFIDTQGNQCALFKDAYVPCQMELQGSQPDFDKCNFKKRLAPGFVEKIASSFIVFPKENPNGISFNDWMEQVMSEPEE